MHQALYRKWRPKSFDSVYGQEHITSVLKYEVSNNRCSHAYLFCGSRGTGKTTCAKLLAKAVNCLSPQNGNPCGECEACRAIESETATDVVEMDAASNTGVDYIRDIREAVMYAPSMLKNRVYIIDEVHMLTQSAFNALLKTLEEPPSQVVFILATTEQQKIPATILSRCQKFEFRRIASDVIAKRLLYIAENENIPLSPDAAKMIARSAQGGMRDAISLLELCAGDGGEISADTVRAVTGTVGRAQASETVRAILTKDADAVFSVIAEVCASSKEMTVFWQEIMDFYRDMLVFKTTKQPGQYLDLTPDEEETIKELAGGFDTATLIRHCTLAENAYSSMLRAGASKRLCAEMALLKMCDDKLDTLPESIVARLSALEEKLAVIMSGGISLQNTAAAENTAPSASKTETSMFKKAVKPEVPKAPELPQDSRKAVRAAPKPVSWWIEAAKRIGEKNPSMFPFMKLSRAYQSDGKITVRVEGDIGMMMLDTPEMRQQLSALSAALSDAPLPPSAFEFIQTEPESTQNPIDELPDET